MFLGHHRSGCRQHGDPAHDAEIVLGDLRRYVTRANRLQPEPVDELDDPAGRVVAGDPLFPRLGSDLIQRPPDSRAALDGGRVGCMTATGLGFNAKSQYVLNLAIWVNYT